MGTLIDRLFQFYSAAFINKLLMVGAVWIFWPGTMFLIGAIGESRLVPVWKHQSKAFIPGDLLLGIALVAEISMHKIRLEPYYYSLKYWGFIFLYTALVVFPALRKRDVINYPPRAIRSPTKIFHDTVGYIVIPTVMIGLGAPYLTLQSITAQENRASLTVFFLGVVGYILCVVIDVKAGFTEEDARMRQPSDWNPIWKTLGSGTSRKLQQ